MEAMNSDLISERSLESMKKSVRRLLKRTNDVDGFFVVIDTQHGPRVQESGPALAVRRQAPIYYPGWILYYVEVKKNERRPADRWVCPSGGDWYPVESKFFTVTLSGTVYVDTSLTVACCNCCYTFREGKSCHILHPWKGTGDQEVPKQEPPFRGRNFGREQ